MAQSFDNSQPIYIQICNELKTKIVGETLKPNEKLSSVRNLAVEYNVNPNTIVKTLAILESEGYIYTDSTNGKFVTEDTTFIKNAKKEYLNEKIKRFVNEMSLLGYSKEDIINILEKRG